ncbi:hypothetical protein RIF29_27628 [Crotalaria pallida]|uniref:Uncharacterized protein n=1 Tax=Crotalaria pallida TaxID=3830 RepID=A0AAN9EQD3_CROPI
MCVPLIVIFINRCSFSIPRFNSGDFINSYISLLHIHPFNIDGKAIQFLFALRWIIWPGANEISPCTGYSNGSSLGFISAMRFMAHVKGVLDNKRFHVN